MVVQEILRREGLVTGRAGNRHSLVVLRPGVGVIGAWIDAQFGGILWAIVDKHLLMLQNVLDGPTNDQYQWLLQ